MTEHGQGTGSSRAVGAATGAATGALVAAPVALAIGAAGGLLFGALVTWLIVPGGETVEVPRDPTPQEIAAACAVQFPSDEGERSALLQAQEKVATLERDVASRERRVKELEAEMAQRAERGKDLASELRQVKADLKVAREELSTAQQEKEGLLSELRLTREELSITRTQRDAAREDALFNRWNDFLKTAQLEICDKGNRKKLGNCRETIDLVLATPDRQARYAHCIRSAQAAPVVLERTDSKIDLPPFAEMIDETKKQTEGWMVIFCDPTLPEAKDAPLAAGRLPPTPGGLGSAPAGLGSDPLVTPGTFGSQGSP